MKLRTILITMLVQATAIISNAWYDTNKINIETSIENLNHYSDLVMVDEGLFSDALLTIVPRLSGWSYFSSPSVYTDYADTVHKRYKFQWSYNPNNSFYITERLKTTDGNIVEASCTTSEPLIATCDISLYGDRTAVFFVTAR